MSSLRETVGSWWQRIVCLARGVKGYAPADRAYLAENLAASNRSRLTALCGIMLVLELANFVVDVLLNSHPDYRTGYISANVFLLALNVTSLVLLRGPLQRAMFLRWFRGFVWVYLILFSLGTLAFATLDALERQSLLNYILLMAALTVVPLLEPRESGPLIVGCAALYVALLVAIHAPAFLLQQALMIAFMGVALSCLFFRSYCATLMLRKQLEESNAKLARLSETDHLTGMYNRWGLEKRLRETRSDESLVVALLDIDDFKQYNDTHGHLAGDCCLSGVARDIQSVFVPDGAAVACRFGGEEFLIASSLPLDAMVARLFVLQDMLAQAAYRLPDGTVLPPVRLSMGLARAASGEAPDFDVLYEQADRELYHAKQSGKNAVFYQGRLIAPPERR